MDISTSGFPVTVRFDLTASGFRAEFSDRSTEPIEAPTIDELLDRVRGILAPAAIDEDDPGGPDFDADLERIIREDRELLDRLAQ